MSLDPRSVALQGLGGITLAVALQGFVVATVAPPVEQAPTYYTAGLSAMQRLKRQQVEEDEVILAIIQQFVMEA